jgi:diguanylate cyclase (GGDEF)-like protein
MPLPFLTGPDARALELGREGEVVASRFRLLLVNAAMVVPIIAAFLDPHDPEPWIGIATGAAVLSVGIPIAIAARRPELPAWVILVSCLLDVTMVSAANAAFIISGQAHAATNGRVFFPAYLIALSMTCLRCDVRLCLLSGAVAMIQYATVVLWAINAGDIIGIVHPTYGSFRWDNQFARLAVLALGTAVNVTIVRQSQRYFAGSMYDALTGLPNRRYARQRLAEMTDVAKRTQRPVVVAIADIDHFKRVNDLFGHAAGDALLRRTGRLLRQHFRSSDVVSRYGGEEFVVALPETDPVGAMDRIRSFREAFGGCADTTRHGSIPATISIGVAIYPEDGDNADDLLDTADARLYEAKNAGRNRVVAPRAATA